MTTSTVGRAVHLVRRPRGLPQETDFEVVAVDLPSPGEGDLLVRNLWMTVDPSMRIRMNADSSEYLPPFALGSPLGGFAVGTVEVSRSPDFRPGDLVLHSLGWRDRVVVGTADRGYRGVTPVETADEEAARAYLNALGSTGLTAYMGLFDVAELREGDVVFVSAGAGGVGSLAVQLALAHGHPVVASAGTPAKVDYLRGLGASAFCYRAGPVRELLRAAAPAGIDVYFDSVGGEQLEAALEVMRPGGRVALCGQVPAYSAAVAPPGPRNLFTATLKGLTLRGYLARSYAQRIPAFRAAMRPLLDSGRVVPVETLFRGLDQAPAAFIAMLGGGTRGKTLVDLRS